MPKIETLKKRKDFLRLSARGHKFVTPAFVVQVAPNTDENDQEIRVGYTASRKVGSAVDRNRAKRRLRSLVKDIFPSYTVKGYDYVLIARYYVLSRSYERMCSELKQVLESYKGNMNE